MTELRDPAAQIQWKSEVGEREREPVELERTNLDRLVQFQAERAASDTQPQRDVSLWLRPRRNGRGPVALERWG